MVAVAMPSPRAGGKSISEATTLVRVAAPPFSAKAVDKNSIVIILFV